MFSLQAFWHYVDQTKSQTSSQGPDSVWFENANFLPARFDDSVCALLHIMTLDLNFTGEYLIWCVALGCINVSVGEITKL